MEKEESKMEDTRLEIKLFEFILFCIFYFETM